MLYSPSETEKSRSAEQRAAVFVDYENLFSHLYGRTGPRARPDELISELLDELRRYLLEEMRTQTAMITAYADFSEMHGNGQYIQRGLYLHGIEPRFVPASLQRNAAEIQLCVDAIEVLYNRQDVRTLVIVTGDRPYLPVVQQLKRYGSRAIIATFMPPPSTDQLPYVEDDVFLNAHNLLSEGSRRSLASTSAVHRSTSSYSSAPAASYPTGRPHPVEYREISHSGALHALEIIEEHFGQYEEVYLTPLLRKLSELLDDEQYDPKSLISELEDAGAVWLEKRRGFPYDYTVLIIDTEHPDVSSIQKRIYRTEESAPAPAYTPPDYPEDYPEEEYDDEYAEDYDEEEAYSNGAAAEVEEADPEYSEDYVDAEEEEEDR